MKRLSKSSLGIVLSALKGFKEPKVRVEQYSTEPEIAAEVLWTAYMANDIENKTIADLGCGTGILGIGALILGAKEVYFIDSDKAAIETARSNLEYAKSESSIPGKPVFIHSDIKAFKKKVDTVLQNPPFGVKVRHADKVFLEKAFETGKTIYTIHKSESKSFLKAFCRDNKADITGFWEFRMPLKQTMEFHRKKLQRIDISVWRIETGK